MLDHQYIITSDGARLYDFGSPTAALTAAVRTVPGGYNLEIAIPASQLGPAPLTADRTLGFTLALDDDDDGGGLDSWLVWRGTRSNRPDADWSALRLVSDVLAYEDVTDTYIVAGAPEENKDASTSLRVRGGDLIATLLRFDLPRFPRGAAVTGATVELYAKEMVWPNPVEVAAYRMNRAWAVDEATWQQSASGQNWEVAGANGVPLDREETPLDVQVVNAADTWVTWDIADAFQAWSPDPSSNHGIVLKGVSGPDSEVAFASTEDGWRPHGRMQVQYYLFGPLPPPGAQTPTPTVTPTSTPTRTYTPTPTPSGTPTPTATPTFAVLPTGTPTPTVTLAMTGTASPTPTAPASVPLYQRYFPLVLK